MSDGGKGSAPRPIPDYKEYEKNWDRIFGRDKEDDKPTEEKDHEEAATVSSASVCK